MGASSFAFPMLGCMTGTRFHGAVHAIDGTPSWQPVGLHADTFGPEPSALPFDEVWGDLAHPLERRRKFKTLKRWSEFTAGVGPNTSAIAITTSGRNSIRINEVELIEFWQQLRVHGYTHRGIAPSHRNLPYLMPIFDQLDYVRSVAVSDTASRLKTRPRAALQVVPPPIRSNRSKAGQAGCTAVAGQA